MVDTCTITATPLTYKSVPAPLKNGHLRMFGSLWMDVSKKNTWTRRGARSPQKPNYHKFRQYTDSRVYIHPPWKIEEVGVLFDQIGEGLLAEFNRINVKLSEKSGPDVENNLSSSIYGSLDGNNPPLVESRELLTKIVNELKEEFVDIGSVTPTENKLWNEIQARFTIVGGRIRLLLSDSTCARDLLSEVDRAVECISFEELDKISALDYTSIRSILYSLMPKEGAISGYYIKITLKYIQSQYQSRLHRGVYNDMNSLFKAFFSQKQDGGTAGIIFEKSALKLLSSSGKPISCRHLKSRSESSIKLERLEVQYFSENENIMDARYSFLGRDTNKLMRLFLPAMNCGWSNLQFRRTTLLFLPTLTRW